MMITIIYVPRLTAVIMNFMLADELCLEIRMISIRTGF